jgi:cation-transporting ATPase 13A3/4/5
VYFYVKWQPWFEAYEDSTIKDEKDFTSYENAVVFMVSIFQYVGQSIIYSKGAPFRRSIFSNVLLSLAYLLVLAFNLILSLAPIHPLLDEFSLKFIKDIRYKIVIIGIAWAHFFLAFIIESFLLDPDPIVNYDVKEKEVRPSSAKKSCCSGSNKKQIKLSYNDIEYELRNKPNWPVINVETPIQLSKSKKSFVIEPKSVENVPKNVNGGDADVSKVYVEFNNNMNNQPVRKISFNNNNNDYIIEEIDYL